MSTARSWSDSRLTVAKARPIVGVRTASHAFQNWLAFDRGVLGGNYQMHWEHGPRARVRFEPASEGHPLLEDVAEFSSAGSLYRNTRIATDASLLMSASTDEHDEPVTWTRTHAGRARLLHVAGTPGGFRRAQLPPPAGQRGPVVRRETVTGGHAHIPFGE